MSSTIKSFANYSGVAYLFTDLQSGHQKKVSVAKVTTHSSSMEIPVCDSASDFGKGDYITVSFDNVTQWYVWQHKDTDGDCVRCTPTGYVPGPAPKIDGAYDSGGSKGLSVMTDGTLIMTTYSS